MAAVDSLTEDMFKPTLPIGDWRIEVNFFLDVNFVA
jgi:hypothetical protein